jgi:malic enzyme
MYGTPTLNSVISITNHEELSTAYTPGVARSTAALTKTRPMLAATPSRHARLLSFQMERLFF